MNPIAELYRLQQIDITWEKVRRRILQLQKLSGGSPELIQARERTQATEKELHKTRTEQRDAELEATSLAGRIDESEKLLMGGQVRNPKELEALQANVESMRRHKSALDDKGMEALVKAEELNQRFQEQSKQLASQEADWATKQQSIDEELNRRKKEFVQLKAMREQAVKSIKPKMLEQYEYLRGRKNGIAVAKVEDDSCGACHMQIPVGVIGTARRSEELVSCTACGRILYAE